jgi:hypothetical protein
VSCRDKCVKMGYDDGIEYGITRKYVETRNWDIWEVFREFVQNALDEMHEVRGTRPLTYPCRVEYKGYTPVTIIEDDGRGLATHYLLIGQSEKKEWQRGRFGEGLKLALLTSAHRGINVKIRSGDREIIPTFVRKNIEGIPVDVFCVCYKKGLPEIKGTRVEIYGYNLCNEYRTRFVQGLPPECFKYTYSGTEWWDVIDKKCTDNESYVYVRDIFVSKMYDAQGKPACFSYNLYNVAIDESRRIPSGGAIRDDVRVLWYYIVLRANKGDTGAYEAVKEILQCIVKNCRPGFSSGIPIEIDMDTFFHIHYDEAGSIRKAFEELYGADMLFISDEDLRRLADYVDAKYIFCPQPVGHDLQKILDTIDKLRKHIEGKMKGIVRKEEMPSKTRRVVELLEQIARLVFPPLEENIGIQYGILDENTHGMCDAQTKTITVNIRNLEVYCDKIWDICVWWYIGVVGHELAHLYSRANDGTVEFEKELTKIMSFATTKAIMNAEQIRELLGELDRAMRSPPSV